MTTNARPPLRPKVCLVPAVATLRPGYGARRRRREAAKVPLFAELPGILQEPSEYEAQMAANLSAYNRQFRGMVAAQWRTVRRWLDQASAEDVELFFLNWAFRPHSSEYAADVVTQIERHRGRSDGRKASGLRLSGIAVGVADEAT